MNEVGDLKKVKTFKLTNGDEVVTYDAKKPSEGKYTARAPLGLGINPVNGEMQLMPYIFTAKAALNQVKFEPSVSSVLALEITDEDIAKEYLAMIGLEKSRIVTLNG